MHELTVQTNSMATARQRAARRQRRQRQRQQQQSRNGIGNGVQRQVEANNRTLTFNTQYKEIVKSDSGIVKCDISGAAFAHLGKKLNDCVNWRIRSARATWHSLVGADSNVGLALYLAPLGAAWKPNDYLDCLNRGGVGKLARHSNWGSNTLGAQDSYVDSSNLGGCLWMAMVNAPTAPVDLGTLTLTLTIQMVGHK